MPPRIEVEKDIEIKEVDLRANTIGDHYVDFRAKTIVNPASIPETRVKSIKRIVFHCTDAPHWSPEKLSNFFIYERGFNICSYSYYVMADHIYHMVGDNVITPHAAPFNSESISFSIDYYATRDEINRIKLDDNVYSNAQKIAIYLCVKHQVLPVKNKMTYTGLVGHRELPYTGFFKDAQDVVHLRKTCPGMAINLDTFRYTVARGIQEFLNTYADPKLAVDGIFGPKTKSVFERVLIVG